MEAMGLEPTNLLTASQGPGVHPGPYQSADLGVLNSGIRRRPWRTAPVAYIVAYISGIRSAAADDMWQPVQPWKDSLSVAKTSSRYPHTDSAISWALVSMARLTRVVSA